MEPFDAVRRESLASFLVGPIGRGTQGSIFKVAVGGRTAALKDISGRSLAYRLLVGRWLLAREARVYRRLQGIPGVPRFYGSVDADAFLFEYVEGSPLSDYPRDAALPPAFFDALAELVERIHARGVVHSDLKHKKNILVARGGRPYLIDFGASWTRGAAWNLPARWLYRQFEEIDRSAVSKIRDRFAHGNPQPQDYRNLERRNLMERFGSAYQAVYRLFSRKHAWRRRRARSTGRPR